MLLFLCCRSRWCCEWLVNDPVVFGRGKRLLAKLLKLDQFTEFVLLANQHLLRFLPHTGHFFHEFTSLLFQPCYCGLVVVCRRNRVRCRCLRVLLQHRTDGLVGKSEFFLELSHQCGATLWGRNRSSLGRFLFDSGWGGLVCVLR